MFLCLRFSPNWIWEQAGFGSKLDLETSWNWKRLDLETTSWIWKRAGFGNKPELET
ncbi:hypothetical protein KI387_039038, partial [Taxus chinensis]